VRAGVAVVLLIHRPELLACGLVDQRRERSGAGVEAVQVDQLEIVEGGRRTRQFGSESVPGSAGRRRTARAEARRVTRRPGPFEIENLIFFLILQAPPEPWPRGKLSGCLHQVQRLLSGGAV